jgi:hypothetical protein
MKLLQFLFTAILILWLIRLLLRVIFPVVVRSAFGKMQDQGQNSQNRRPEGSISIDYMPPQDKKKGNADKLGEFVDYEEVK